MAAGIAAAKLPPTPSWSPWPPTRPAGARCVTAALTNDAELPNG